MKLNEGDEVIVAETGEVRLVVVQCVKYRGRVLVETRGYKSDEYGCSYGGYCAYDVDELVKL